MPEQEHHEEAPTRGRTEAENQRELPAASEIGEQLRPTPRIYVASLSDYNAGRLHGVWVDADCEPDEIWDPVNAMLAASTEPVAEEVAIHDYEGFGRLHLSEYESLEMVARLARGIVEHGLAYAAYAGMIGSFEWAEGLDKFEERYRGTWESVEQYAQELLDEFGIERELDRLPEWIRPYISVDVAVLGNDLTYDLDVVQDDSGVHVFDS